MINIIRKNWAVNLKFLLLFIGWLILVPRLPGNTSLKYIVVLSTLMVGFEPIAFWMQDRRFPQRMLDCSLPIDRITYIRGSFIACWSLILVMLALTFLSAIFISNTLDGYSGQLGDVLQLKVVTIALWLPTIIMLLFYTIYARYNVMTALIAFLSVAFLGFSTIMGNAILHSPKFAGAGSGTRRSLLRTLDSVVMNYHDTSIEILISIILLILVNVFTLKFSEFLFMRNDNVS